MGGTRIEILEGPGIHTGEPGRVELIRRGSGPSGIRFRFPGSVQDMPWEHLGGMTRSARRATVLGGVTGGPILHTPEHLLAALLFFSDCPLDVHLQSTEPPNLDGSSLPFRDALARLFPERAAAPVWEEYPSSLSWDHAGPEGSIRVRPAGRFSLDYAWEHGPLRQACSLQSPEEVWSRVLPARTFIFHREWKRGMEAGLLRGAGLESGLLLSEDPEEHAALSADHPEWAGGPFPLLNRPGWRMEGEAARHKALDLLGDLALACPGLPRLEIAIRNGGHALNHLLLDRLAAASQGERPGAADAAP